MTGKYEKSPWWNEGMIKAVYEKKCIWRIIYSKLRIRERDCIMYRREKDSCKECPGREQGKAKIKKGTENVA